MLLLAREDFNRASRERVGIVVAGSNASDCLACVALASAGIIASRLGRVSIADSQVGVKALEYQVVLDGLVVS